MLDKRVTRFTQATADWTGEKHYKNSQTEPIDLIQACGILVPFACANIIKYASRIAQGNQSVDKTRSDLRKIWHYAGFIWEDLEGDQ